MSVDRLQRLIDTPADEPLADDLVAWMREALEAAVLDQVPVAEALAIQGSQGVPSAPAQVRRNLRDRTLLVLGESLEPEGSAYARAAAILDATVDYRPMTPEQRAALKYAERLAPIPEDLRTLHRLFLNRDETRVSDHVCDRRAG